MIYFYWYLGLGLIFLIFTYIESRLNKDAQKNRELYALTKPRSQTLGKKLFNNLVIPFIAILLAFIFWPVIITWVAQDRLAKYRYKNSEIRKEEPFTVKKEDLIREYSIEQIEEQEMMTDPLQAVPIVPFGFLNPIWNNFKEKIVNEEKIWR